MRSLVLLCLLLAPVTASAGVPEILGSCGRALCRAGAYLIPGWYAPRSAFLELRHALVLESRRPRPHLPTALERHLDRQLAQLDEDGQVDLLEKLSGAYDAADRSGIPGTLPPTGLPPDTVEKSAVGRLAALGSANAWLVVAWALTSQPELAYRRLARSGDLALRLRAVRTVAGHLQALLLGETEFEQADRARLARALQIAQRLLGELAPSGR